MKGFATCLPKHVNSSSNFQITTCIIHAKCMFVSVSCKMQGTKSHSYNILYSKLEKMN